MLISNMEIKQRFVVSINKNKYHKEYEIKEVKKKKKKERPLLLCFNSVQKTTKTMSKKKKKRIEQKQNKKVFIPSSWVRSKKKSETRQITNITATTDNSHPHLISPACFDFFFLFIFCFCFLFFSSRNYSLSVFHGVRP